MKITILSGVPGSGKSTLANSRLGFVVSADDFFMGSGSYNFDAKQLGAAHASCLREFARRVMDPTYDVDIFVDNTNTTTVEIAPYYALALAYGHQVEIVTLVVLPEDLGKCATRNSHGVPEASIRRMAENIHRRQMPRHWVIRTMLATF